MVGKRAKNNRMSTAFSMGSGPRFGSYGKGEDGPAEVDEIGDFILHADMEEDDAAMDDTRSAKNLEPHKNTFGNRFSTVEADSRASFFAINPLA